MARPPQLKRLFGLMLLLVLAFAGLGYRLVDLQVLRHDELQREAFDNRRFIRQLEPRRGDIVDRKGNLLATSVFVKTVIGNPALMTNRIPEVARAIAPLLQLNEAELVRKLSRTHKNSKGEEVPVQYVLLKRKVSSDAWEKIQSTMSNLTFGVDERRLPKKQRSVLNTLRASAITTEPVDGQLRIYPNGSLAAHVIGYVGVVEQTNGGPASEITVGVDGIEKRFDSKLAGVRGIRVSEQDGHRREVMAFREQDLQAHDGCKVVLTIDSVIQHILETSLEEGLKAHSPKSISGIVLRPRTGEILGMATLPTFDPNNPVVPGQAPDALDNRVISDAAEPGSTFKIVVVSGALNDGTVKLTDEFDCEHGRFYYAKTWLHDDTTKLGILSVKGIITKSSNIGAAKIGIKMGQSRLYDYVTAFGYGRPTGIPLSHESAGVVRDLSKWNPVSISRIPMGHEVSATCLQTALAMGAIANDGVLMQPMLVDRLVDTDGSTAVTYYPQPVRRVISEETDKLMIEALKSVVSEEGTGARAAMTHYTVAGKTGTAQKWDHGYSNDKFFSSFVGFFPADNPELLIYVAMDSPQKKEGHFGGEVAAPIFKEIADKAASYLNIVPDKDQPGLPGGSGLVASPFVPVKTAEAKVQ